MEHLFKFTFTFAKDYLFKKSVRRFFFKLSLKLWTVILDFSESSRLFQIVEALYKKDF